MKLPFRILVVEEDAEALSRLVATLRNAKYLVTGATTTDAARGLLALGWYDLLITAAPLRGLSAMLPSNHGRSTQPEMGIIILSRTPAYVEDLDARRFGAEMVRAPFTTRELLAATSRVLESVRRTRRWQRKRVVGGFRVTANGAPAAVVDVSYGGLRIELTTSTDLPEQFDVEIAGINLHLPVEAVWKNRSHDGAVLTCGAALSTDGTPAARTWRAIVDRLDA